MHLYYQLDEHGNPVPMKANLSWARWMETADRCVALTEFDDCRVSTVFLGTPHVSNSLNDHGHDYFFETMIFAPESIMKKLEQSELNKDTSILSWFVGFDIQRRYKTRQEAVAGHEDMVNKLKQILLLCN